METLTNNKQQKPTSNDVEGAKKKLAEREDKMFNNSILFSLEIEKNFKLMSYRMITKEQFIDATANLIKQWQKPL